VNEEDRRIGDEVAILEIGFEMPYNVGV